MLAALEHTFYAAGLMFWKTFWALVLGFSFSALLQVFVRRESMMEHFGRSNLRSVGLATLLGAASSSCSYAAAATARTAFKKGAHLVPALAFMFAATNLVVELGVILWILLGWHFVLAEVVGAFVLIAMMWALVALTMPRGLMESARAGGSEQEASCHHHGAPTPVVSKPRQVASAFLMDVSMMWKEILLGFLIGGFLMAVVPQNAWQGLFLQHAPWGWRLLENALVGVFIAVISFVCSVGNLPLAAVLWSGGISFGGVISFIYADLIIIPLLLIYRKYYGLKAGAYIAAILGASMVLAGVVVDLLFTAAGLVPQGPRPPSPMQEGGFAWNYTTWLDLVAAGVLVWLISLNLFRNSGARESSAHDEHHPAARGSHATT